MKLHVFDKKYGLTVTWPSGENNNAVKLADAASTVCYRGPDMTPRLPFWINGAAPRQPSKTSAKSIRIFQP